MGANKLSPEEIAVLPYRPCAGLMLLNAKGEIFAGQRIDSTVEAWQMPQGGVDAGETPEQAALRELGEEVGLLAEHVQVLRKSKADIPYDLPDELIGKLWKGKYRGQMQTWFALRLIAPDSAINIQTDEPEFKTWRWMNAPELLEAIVPFKQDVYRQVFAEFSDLIGAPGEA